MPRVTDKELEEREEKEKKERIKKLQEELSRECNIPSRLKENWD